MKLSDVDPVKCPHLYAALQRGLDHQYNGWAHVVELRREGKEDSADRLVRKLLGVQGPPMSEETKEKLRKYSEDHKEEIKARRHQEAETRRRTLALLTTGGRIRR